jgi:hypothetical protein
LKNCIESNLFSKSITLESYDAILIKIGAKEDLRLGMDYLSIRDPSMFVTVSQ